VTDHFVNTNFHGMQSNFDVLPARWTTVPCLSSRPATVCKKIFAELILPEQIISSDCASVPRNQTFLPSTTTALLLQHYESAWPRPGLRQQADFGVHIKDS
jgi:hypothetical protein